MGFLLIMLKLLLLNYKNIEYNKVDNTKTVVKTKVIDQYKQQLDSMMKREVSRGEFLKIIGVSLFGLIGITGFLKNLHEVVPAPTTGKDHPASGGYGRSVYGR